MKRAWWMMLFLAVLLSVNAVSWGEEARVRWDLKDLYFYDEDGLMRRLELSTKVRVRFLPSHSAEDRTRLFDRVKPLQIKEDPNGIYVFLLEFAPAVSTDLLNEVSNFDFVEVDPVVFMDNIESVAEGIVVTTKTPVSLPALEKRLRALGDFTIRQAQPAAGGWLLTFDSIKPPLHIFLLANLISQDPWVKRAYPYFKYLHDPIVATQEVLPASGTIGEIRELKLTIRVFHPQIKIDESNLPRFGEGDFIPKSDSRAPGSFLFRLLGDRKRDEHKSQRSRVLVYSWQFRHFAIGSASGWIVPSQPVPYEKNGERLKTTSTPAVLVVTSLIGDLKIEDMPPPRLLVIDYPKALDASEDKVASPPVYWFDKLPVGAPNLAKYFYAVSLGSLFVVGAVILSGAFGRLRVFARRRARKRDNVLAVKVLLQEAETKLSKEAYGKLEEAFRVVCALVLGTSSFSSFKEFSGSIQSFLPETQELGVRIYRGIEESYRPDFVYSDSRVKELSVMMLDFLGRLQDRIKIEEK